MQSSIVVIDPSEMKDEKKKSANQKIDQKIDVNRLWVPKSDFVDLLKQLHEEHDGRHQFLVKQYLKTNHLSCLQPEDSLQMELLIEETNKICKKMTEYAQESIPITNFIENKHENLSVTEKSKYLHSHLYDLDEWLGWYVKSDVQLKEDTILEMETNWLKKADSRYKLIHLLGYWFIIDLGFYRKDCCTIL
jgi:hypothetical protein